MQVATSVAVMQALRLYYNYAGGTFCYSYVGGSSCCNHLCDCFCWNYSVRILSSNYMQVTVSAFNMGVTVFIMFLQVRVSVATMQVVLSAVRNCFSRKMHFTVSTYCSCFCKSFCIAKHSILKQNYRTYLKMKCTSYIDCRNKLVLHKKFCKVTLQTSFLCIHVLFYI